MTDTLDIRVNFNKIDNVNWRVSLTPANNELQGTGAESGEFFIIGTLNALSSVFPTKEDAANYYYSSKAADLLSQVNNNYFGGSGTYTLGNRINYFDSATKVAFDGKFTTPTGTTSQVVLGNGTLGALPSSVRTTSALTGVSIVTSTSAGGTQIHATKDSTVHGSVSTSITTTVGGTSTSEIVAEICATNSTTPGDWQEAGRVGDSNTITLAIALNSVQPGKKQLCFDLPGGWFFRYRSLNGAGTHSEGYISGQKTIHG